MPELEVLLVVIRRLVVQGILEPRQAKFVYPVVLPLLLPALQDNVLLVGITCRTLVGGVWRIAQVLELHQPGINQFVLVVKLGMVPPVTDIPLHLQAHRLLLLPHPHPRLLLRLRLRPHLAVPVVTITWAQVTHPRAIA